MLYSHPDMPKPWFQKRIRSLRVKLAMTQEQFAHHIGVTTVTVNRWERGHTSPKGLSVVRLEKAEGDMLS
jgi:DNA-binding transcriptional regulator YiaG